MPTSAIVRVFTMHVGIVEFLKMKLFQMKIIFDYIVELAILWHNRQMVFPKETGC